MLLTGGQEIQKVSSSPLKMASDLGGQRFSHYDQPLWSKMKDVGADC